MSFSFSLCALVSIANQRSQLNWILNPQFIQIAVNLFRSVQSVYKSNLNESEIDVHSEKLKLLLIVLHVSLKQKYVNENRIMFSETAYVSLLKTKTRASFQTFTFIKQRISDGVIFIYFCTAQQFVKCSNHLYLCGRLNDRTEQQPFMSDIRYSFLTKWMLENLFSFITKGSGQSRFLRLNNTNEMNQIY